MVLTTVVFLEGCRSDVVKGRQERKRKAGGRASDSGLAMGRARAVLDPAAELQ